jgi:hypothetical protein
MIDGRGREGRGGRLSSLPCTDRQTDDTAAAGVGLIEEFRMTKRDTVSLI